MIVALFAQVTLTASPAALRLATFVDPAAPPTAGAVALHTEMSFNAQEFERFEVLPDLSNAIHI